MPSRKRPPWDLAQPERQKLRITSRQVVCKEVPGEMHESERLARLAALLSDVLSRRLGQVSTGGSTCSARPLDYPPVLLPTTDAQSNAPMEANQ